MDFEEMVKIRQEQVKISNRVPVLSDLVFAWNASAEAHKPRWIPVSERLPDKENMICAVISENFECPMIRIWMKENWFNVPARLNITHWLELPEMPE